MPLCPSDPEVLVTNELVFATDAPRSTISDRVRRGALRRIHRGVYTTDLATPMERIVRDNWAAIVGRLVPGATITDRAVVTGGPHDGVLYLARAARPLTVNLPGLLVVARTGAAPLDGDLKLPGGLHLASRGRALAENAQPSRAVGRRPRRTLTADELDTWIDRIVATDGRERLAEHRNKAAAVADAVGTRPADIERLNDTVGTILGSRKAGTTSLVLEARLKGAPIDQSRLSVFTTLATALRASAPQNRPGNQPPFDLAFFEAYFSNYIEGTEFEVDEARKIIDSGEAPETRHADGHDLLGTFKAIGEQLVTPRPTNVEDRIERIKHQHSLVMGGRPDLHPGEFKTLQNIAGNTTFVAPALVEGTLRAGLRLVDDLDTGWERAVLAMFVVAEVHPFEDGNGRSARLTMNDELTTSTQQRIIVPTALRDDYLAGLRRLTRHDDPDVFIKTMRFAHDYTAAIDWETSDTALADLTATSAFENEPRLGQRLRLPTR